MTSDDMELHVYQLTDSQLTDNLGIESLNTLSPDLQSLRSLKDFTKELEKYANRNKTQQPQKKKQKLGFAYIPSTVYISQQLIFSALRKCITTETFWSQKGMRVLLEHNYIMPGHDDEVVFQCILKYKSFELLKFVTQSFHIVADKYMIRILTTVLDGVVIDDATKAAHKSRYYSDCPVSDAVIADLSYAMTLPVNKTTLSHSLKLLTLDEALLLLQCLVFMLHVVSPALVKDPVKSSKFDAGMTEGKIVMWIELLLTAHLMGFATTDTMGSLIPDIRLCIQKQQNYYTKIKELASFLQHVREGKTLEKSVGIYTIETITL